MKRLKKILKWTAVVFGILLAIGLIANAVFIWSTDARLASQLEAIRTAGEPLTFADLARPPIPPEKNADKYLRKADADVNAIENEMDKWRESEKITPNDFYSYFNEQWPMPGKMSEKIRKALDVIFAAHPKAIPLLQQAADCPDYDARLDYSPPVKEFITRMLPFLQGLRSKARVLEYRSRLLLNEGNYNEAARMALCILRLARHFQRNPLVVGYLVTITIRGIGVEEANAALQTGAVSKDIRDALDAELAVQEGMDGAVWAFRSDRAFTIDSFQDMPGRNCWFVARGIWNMQESACLELFPKIIGLFQQRTPYCQVKLTIESSNSHLARLEMPAFQAAYVAALRSQASVRCLRVLIALQRHSTAGSNKVPGFSEIGLSAETTTDPFNGRPLIVKKLPNGWLIYSVGQNFQDDGGDIDKHHTDVGVGPPPSAKPAAK
jgi:hypothetical protein